ncbi:MAG: type IX secretion system membrane protein PorP/SprF [Sphingobacteriales bacterium]|nr:type IX secretion system membrane protein PorP/SprF [Sphingobacteriales bacterium]
MRKYLLTLILISIFCTVKSQQLHFMSQFLQYNSMYNPAAAGLSQRNFVGVSYRSMWSSFPGNPKTFMVYGDFDLPSLSSGIGTYVYRDETGPTSRTGVQFAYSYHITSKDKKSNFGIGIELRGLQYAIDKTKLSATLANDPALGGAENKFAFDAGAGLFWTNRKLSVGAAVSQLMQSKLQLANVPNSKEGGKLYRHYNFTANYQLQTGDNIFIIPNAMVRLIENSPAEYDFGARVDYQDKIWWGLNYRVNQFWSLQLGLKIMQRVRMSYSYDYYTAPIGVFTDGSGAHEIGLQFDLKKKTLL